MNRTCRLLFAAAFACAAACAAPEFDTALPVWPEGRELRMNDFVEFRATFRQVPGDAPVLRVTGCSAYRIRLNGVFAGYGPARAAKGFFRVDEWPLAAKDGVNNLSIEVSAYNCPTYCIPSQSAFLQAEVVSGGRVLAATGRDFTAFETPRIVKCSRYSFQRAFNEAYRLAQGWSGNELKLSVRPEVRLVERIAPLPDFSVSGAAALLAGTAVRRVDTPFRPPWFMKGDAGNFTAYAPSETEEDLWRQLQAVKAERISGAEDAGDGPYDLAAGTGLIFDCMRNSTGFPVVEVECLKSGGIFVAFDEILSGEGLVDATRGSVANGVLWHLGPGRWNLEAFEPYTFRYMHIYTLDGSFKVSKPRVRAYRNPTASRASFRASDPALEKIFGAARETFAQNAVDVFTDCPGRERAGWLCDSFFTARAALLFTGSAAMERLFLQNYLLPERFENIPEGMLPMCYPADHPAGRFIPNWAMWFVLELEEYLERSGDRATVDALRPRMEALVRYLHTFRNSDGLLEKLPSWVFVEWSRANHLVQDVNYPSNMTWAEVLDAMDRLYGMPELAVEAGKVRTEVRRQSWTGRWFCDNAVRQKDGTLRLSGECTETCQYYAFFFRTATPESHPELWKTLLDEFGPKRRETKAYPEIHFSNAFIGNYLRLCLLSRARLDAMLLDETKGYFSYMAERTGTLWEHTGTQASCNHGFASHAAVFYARNVLGLERLDVRSKTATVRRTGTALDFCEAKFPVDGGELRYGWRRDGEELRETFSAPPGWRLVHAP